MMPPTTSPFSGIADQNRERALVAVSGLFDVVIAEPVADHRFGARVGGVGHNQFGVGGLHQNGTSPCSMMR